MDPDRHDAARHDRRKKVDEDMIEVGGGMARRRPFWRVVAVATILATAAGAERFDPAAIRVIDGDTIELRGQSVRLVGFDTPETWKPGCEYERALGELAANRLAELIGSGAAIEVMLRPVRDRYNRGLGRLLVGNRDVGEILTAEGLARPYEGGRRSGWCG